MDNRLKISVQTGDWYDELFGAEQNPDRAFEFISNLGFEAVDYNLDHTMWNLGAGEKGSFFDADIEDIIEIYRPVKAAMDKWNIVPGQAHAPFPSWFEGKDELNEYIVMAINKLFAVCEFLGCPALVVHPIKVDDEEKRWEINRALYLKLIPGAKKHGVTICLENMFAVRNGHIMQTTCSDASEACRYIDALNEEAGEEIFGYCLDIGHANLCGKDLYREIKMLGKRLTVLHIHDNDGRYDMHQIPYTQKHNWGREQCTDWEGFIRGLRDIGYEGTLSFETFAALKSLPRELYPSFLRLTADIGKYFRNAIIS